MKRGFIERVIRERIVDTRKYRYISESTFAEGLVIRRIPLEYLNTTRALNSWESVRSNKEVQA